MQDWFDSKLAAIKTCEGYDRGGGDRSQRASISLDRNENWHLPRDVMMEVMHKAAGQVDVREYPEEGIGELVTSLSERLDVPEASIVLTNGADQGLDLLCQAFLGGEEPAFVVGPTFSFYRLRASVAHAPVRVMEMSSDFTFPLEDIGQQDRGVLFICSPNNPTGNQFTDQDVRKALGAFRGLVVLDEAYVDFASHSLVKWTMEQRNMVVVRTFSKAFGLAGVRLGYLVAHPEVASLINNRIQYPYPVSSLSMAAATEMLARSDLVQKALESVREERSWLTASLNEIEGVTTLESQANFLLTSTPVSPLEVGRRLLARGIAVRVIGDVLNLKNCLRITVGTREMNRRLLDALREVLVSA